MDKKERENTRVVVDDTTIYEIDLSCYRCLSEEDRRRYFQTEEYKEKEGQ